MNSKSNLLTNFAFQFFVPATRGINWQFATAIALDSSQNIAITKRGQIQNLYEDALDLVEPLIGQISGLQVKQPSHIVVCDRHEWLVNTTDSLSDLFDKTFATVWDIIEKQSKNNLIRKTSQSIMTTQLGLLLGLLSTKVLGQFDTGLPNDRAKNLVFIVEPNIMQRELELGLERSPFRLWILAHELTHNLQFQNFSWLRDYYFSLIQKVAQNFGEKLTKSKNSIEAAFSLLVNKENWRLISEIQAFMSLIEGYADYVMFNVGKMLPDFRQLSPVFKREKRPDEPLIKQILAKLLGFDMKANQYKQGLAFVSKIAELKDLHFLNSKLDGPQKLPTIQELADPKLWLRRINK